MFDGTDPYLTLLVFSLVIISVSLAGASIPYIRKMDNRQVHLMVALSAGIFLGVLLFMLLPETFAEAHDGMDAALWIAAGFMAVLLIDVILKRMHTDACPHDACTDTDHKHELTSMTAFIGLAIHAAVDGIILSIALTEGGGIGMAVLIGISLHKFADMFALSSTFRLTDMSKRNVMLCMVIFALITPAAAFVSMPLIDMAESLNAAVPLAIAAGTFMYVGIYALLPEAFCERRDAVAAFILVAIGMVAVAAISVFLGGSAHAH